MSTTATTASIHTPGTPVSGTYCDVPFSGTVVSSRPNSYNYDRWYVTVAVDEASRARLMTAGLRARDLVMCTVLFNGDPIGGMDSDGIEVAGA